MADTVEIIVNESSVVTRCWGPYQADITHALRAGANQIALKVHNNYANLFRFGDDRSEDEGTEYGLLSKALIRFVEPTMQRVEG